LVLAGPDGDLTSDSVQPIELLAEPANGRTLMRVVLEDGDLEKFAAGGVLWVGFYGPVPVFTLDVITPDAHIETGD